MRMPLLLLSFMLLLPIHSLAEKEDNTFTMHMMRDIYDSYSFYYADGILFIHCDNAGQSRNFVKMLSENEKSAFGAMINQLDFFEFRLTDPLGDYDVYIEYNNHEVIFVYDAVRQGARDESTQRFYDFLTYVLEISPEDFKNYSGM